MKQGYIYIASGEKYIQQAVISANSLRQVEKKAHITLITDKDVKNKVFDIIQIRHMEYSFIDKVFYMYKESPYERTFFLDADTYFYGNCNELFNLLDYFDMCVAAAPGENEIIIEGKPIRGYLPYNTGCIVFRKNLKTEIFFKEWLNIYIKIHTEIAKNSYYYYYYSDQTPFSVALLYSNLKTYVLPNNWNARLPFFINLKGLVKIAHGWDIDYEKIKRRINITAEQRCWDPLRKKCIYRDSSIIFDTQYLMRLIRLVFYGFKTLLKKIIL